MHTRKQMNNINRKLKGRNASREIFMVIRVNKEDMKIPSMHLITKL